MCKWSAKVGAFTRFSDETAAPNGRLPEVWCATSMGQLSALRKGGYQKLENILLGKYRRQVRKEGMRRIVAAAADIILVVKVCPVAHGCFTGVHT